MHRYRRWECRKATDKTESLLDAMLSSLLSDHRLRNISNYTDVEFRLTKKQNCN